MPLYDTTFLWESNSNISKELLRWSTEQIDTPLTVHVCVRMCGVDAGNFYKNHSFSINKEETLNH